MSCTSETYLVTISFPVGAEDYLMPIDSNVWVQAMHTESIDPPPFFPQEFEEEANDVLQRNFGMTREHITCDNCVDVYCFLVNALSQ